jgi:hypothetical protein
MEKSSKIDANLKHVAQEKREMAQEMNKKWKKMEKKVQNHE